MNVERHDDYLALIEARFNSTLSEETEARLDEHLRECTSCERAYERWANAERALYPKRADGSLSPAQLDRVAARLLGEEKTPPRSESTRYLFGAVGLALSLGLVVLVAQPSRNSDNGLEARGQSGTQLSEKSTLRVLRIRGGDSAPSVVDLGSRSAESLENGDRLRLLYTNLDGFSYLTVEVRSEDAPARVWIDAVKLEAGVEDARAGGIETVDDTWPRGEVSIVAVFSKTPKPAIGPSVPRDGEDHVVRVVRTNVREDAP